MNQTDCKPMREKLWTERDTDEKLRALVDQVRYLLGAVQRLESQVQALRNHQHGTNGKLLIPIDLDTHYRGSLPMALRDKE